MRLCVVLSFCWLYVLPHSAGAQTNFDRFAPQVAQTDPLTAQEQLKKFHLPPGFEIQLVAAEPEIRKPINLNFDDAGRLYATQSEEYPYAAASGAKMRDVVKRFEQFGPDGRAKKVTTVVDGLNIPIGVAASGQDLIVYSIPNVYLCRDRDGDGVYEDKQVLLGGFGHRDTHGMVNSLLPWIDGWVYACHGFSNTSEVQGADGQKIVMTSGNTFRLRADGSHVEYFTHGQVNPFGLAFDPLGNLYSADCHTLPAYELLRGAWYPSFGKPHDGLGFGPTMMSHNHGSTAISGVAYYAADHFPPEYRDTLFIGNPVTCRVNHDRLALQGSTPKAIEQPDFIRCDDPWFRPVDIELGPDGALYIADFYNRIIGHYEVPLEHPGRDRERGRIWRVVYRGADGKTPPPVMPDLSQAGFQQLVELLRHANLTVRIKATNRLATMSLADADRAQLQQLLLADNENPWQQAHALWVLERTSPSGLSDEVLAPCFDKSPAAVQVHLLKLIANRPDAENFSAKLLDKVQGKLADSDAFVSRAAAEALGQHPRHENLRPLLAAWFATPPEDTHRVHVIRMALRDHLVVPGFYAAATSLTVNEAAAQAQVAELSLGVPNAAAAGFLLGYLQDLPSDRPPHATLLEHAARYVPDDQLPKVQAFAQRFQSSPPEDQLSVVRALYRATQARGGKQSELMQTWQQRLARELLASDRESRVQSGLEMARDFKLAELHDDLTRLAAASSKFANLRTAAIDACVANDATRSVTLLGGILAESTEPMSLRQKAAQALGNINTEPARLQLLALLKTAPERLAIEIAGGLASSAQGSELLLSAVAEGKAAPTVLQEVAIDRRLRASKLPELDVRLAKLTAGLPPRDERLRKLVDERRKSFAQAQSDVALGKKVFEKTCAACHRLAGQGNKIGPELDGVGQRGLDRLLEDVLDPSRNVDQAFRAVQIVTNDGRVILGLPLRREGQVQILADAAGKEIRLPLADIEEQTISPLSPMPANVADLVPEKDFQHLVAFLLQQRSK
jgi:putative heme-binding domain-containing protein